MLFDFFCCRQHPHGAEIPIPEFTIFKQVLQKDCLHYLSAGTARTYTVFSVMSKQSRSATTSASTAMEVSPCLVCKDTFTTEIQAIIQVNHGVLTADNKAILEALPLLNTKDLVSVVFNLMIEKQDASIDSRFSPQKVLPIVTLSKDGSFKKLISPVDEKFFESYKDDGVPHVEWWQHFVGSLMYNDSNGKFGCAVCEVEAMPSQNKLSVNCPRRGQHGDMKVHRPPICVIIFANMIPTLYSKPKNSDASPP